MKKTTYIFRTLFLLLCAIPVLSQSIKKEPIKFEAVIGSTVPDYLISNVLYDSDKEFSIQKPPKKILILDFWATWCSPCVAMIPKIDSLQKAFKGEVDFVAVTTQSKETVENFMQNIIKKYGFAFPTIYSDKYLSRIFPHTSLPHYVWIGSDGKLLAITGIEKINSASIQSMLQNQMAVNWTVKKEARIPYQKDKPLLIDGNGGSGNTLIFHSVLTGYIDGLLAEYNATRPDSIKGRKISARNVNLYWLYSIAYGAEKNHFGENRIIYEVKDKSKITSNKVGLEYAEWMRNGNAYCYEVIVPPAMLGYEFKIMQEDLERYFPYKATVEKRKMKCLILTRTSKEDKLKSKGGPAEATYNGFGCSIRNTHLSFFYAQLSVVYLQKSPIPLFNDTGYDGKVDMDINASLSNVKALNEALAKYDLALVEGEREIEMLVIRDK